MGIHKIDDYYEIDNFIDGAQAVANLVNKGVDSGKLSKLEPALNKIRIAAEKREKYVFPRESLKRTVALTIICLLLSLAMVYFLMISAGTAYYSYEYRIYGLFGIVIFILVEIINVLMIRYAAFIIKSSLRYDAYYDVLKYHSIEIIDDLASMLDIDKSIVEKDLSRAVKKKYIPQGHFGRGNVIFMVSDDIFNEYSLHRAVYDRYFKKLIEERKRMRARTQETEELLELGQDYIDKIHDCNDIIKDKDISIKLERMEKIVATIFHEVDINPAQANKLGVFIGYYLPTTEKLLETYLENDEKLIKGKNLEKAQNEIVNALDTINNAFEQLLERFYQEQELDISSDISAMEIIMKQDGLQENE